MTNRAQFINFIRRLNRGNFYVSSHSFEIYDLLAGRNLATNVNFQLNISKIMLARPEKYRDIGGECHYNIFIYLRSLEVCTTTGATTVFQMQTLLISFQLQICGRQLAQDQ